MTFDSMFDGTSSRQRSGTLPFALVLASLAAIWFSFLVYRSGRSPQHTAARVAPARAILAGAGRPSGKRDGQATVDAGLKTIAARKLTPVLLRPHDGASPVSSVDPAPALIPAGEGSVPEPALAASLPTGTRLMEDRATTGLGKLEAINRTDDDAYVVIVDASTYARVRQVYVKRGESFTLDRLEPGTYKVFFATGLDWDGKHEEFKLDAAYLDFGQELPFQETPSARGTLYDYRTITLNAVPHGDAQAALISKAQFHALTGGPLQAARPASSGLTSPEQESSAAPVIPGAAAGTPDAPAML